MIRLFILLIGSLWMAAPVFAQNSGKKDDAPAFSDSRSYNSSSLFDSGSGKSVKKNRRQANQTSRDLKKQAHKRNKQAYRKKGKSDCDCPGSKKGQRIRRRNRAN